MACDQFQGGEGNPWGSPRGGGRNVETVEVADEGRKLGAGGRLG